MSQITASHFTTDANLISLTWDCESEHAA